MSNINTSTRSPFFPNSKTGQKEIEQTRQAQLMKRNSMERAQDLQARTAGDANVTIPDSIRDFSRIKKVADSTPDIDNTDKIASLKASIQAGTYKPDYDAIADKMLASEY